MCETAVPALETATGEGVADALNVPPGEVRAGRFTAEMMPEDPTDLHVWEAGDWLLANERVAVVIEDVGASDGYDPWGGRLVGIMRVVDGELVPANYNELIPAIGRYIVETTSVGVVDDGSGGGAAIVRAMGMLRPVPFADEFAAPLLPSNYDGIEVAIDYVLMPGAEHVEMIYHVRSEAPANPRGQLTVLAFQKERMAPFTADLAAGGSGFAESPGSEGAAWMGYSDGGETAYAISSPISPLTQLLEVSGTQVFQGDRFTIEPCSITDISLLRVDIGGPGADGLQAAMRRREGIAQMTVSGVVHGADGVPAGGVRVHASRDGQWITRGLTAVDGTFTLHVPGDGAVTLDTWRAGDTSVSQEVAAGASDIVLELPERGMIAVRAIDDSGVGLPVRVQVLPIGGSPELPASWGEELPFGGRLHLEFPVDGAIDLPVPPSAHRVVVSRGFDYELGFDDTVTVGAGETVTVDAVLSSVVDRPGMLCADYHIHTHRSPDSPDAPELKLRSAAGDGLEIPCRSDHEWVKEWETLIADEGLTPWLYGVTSLELTTFVYGHFGVVGLEPRPELPNGGAVPWVGDSPPTVFARVHDLPSDPLLIINHPRGAAAGAYFSYVGYDAATGTVSKMDEWSEDFVAVEVFNDSSFDENLEETVADWFSFLRDGRRVFAVGSSDSHKLERGSPVGYPRTCLDLGAADVQALRATGDGARRVVDATRAGSFVVNGGIYIEATAAGGVGPGGEVQGTGTQMMDVRVQAPRWVDATALEVWVDGALVETVPLLGESVVRLEESIAVTVAPAGSWVVLHARGEMPLDPVFPGRRPFGVTQPIFFKP